jgi:YVTN family beta-propeller protein
LLNRSRVVGSVVVGTDPGYPAFDSQNGFLYVPDTGSFNVSVIDGERNIASVPVGGYPVWATYDSTNGFVYVTIPGNGVSSGYVAVINGTSKIGTITAGVTPLDSVFDEESGLLYVVDGGDELEPGLCVWGNVTVISGMSVVGSFPAGDCPTWAAFDPYNGLVYVGDQAVTVTVINGTTVVGNLSAGGGPSYVMADPINGLVYVADSASGTVTVVDNTSILTSIDLGARPGYEAFDSANGFVYVSNPDASMVSVIDGTELAGSVPVGVEPGLAAFDPMDDDVYVPNALPGTVSVIPPVYPLTFTEAGLYAGTNWSVSIDGFATNSTSTNLSFVESTGTYAYMVTALNGYVANATWGEAFVNGSATEVLVSFTYAPRLVLGMTVEPAAICADDSNWCDADAGEAQVTITADALGINSTVVATAASQPLFLFVPFGSVRVAAAHGFQTRCTVSAPPPGDSICDSEPQLFNGSGGFQYFGFNWSMDSRYNEMYGGDSWSVEFWVYSNGGPFGLVPVDACTTLACKISGSTAVQGEYTRAEYTTPPKSTIVNQSFPLEDLNVEQDQQEYQIEFSEVGLPGGTPWTVSLDDSVQGSNSTAISFQAVNGTHQYSVGSVPGWSPVVRNGTIDVSGNAVEITVGWRLRVYNVSFEESGLQVGTSWSVNLSGEIRESIGEMVGFDVPNGTYVYTAWATELWSATGPQTLTVAGSDQYVSIEFKPHTGGPIPSPNTAAPPPTFLGLPADEGYLTLLGIVVVLALAALTVDRWSRGGGSKQGPPPVR